MLFEMTMIDGLIFTGAAIILSVVVTVLVMSINEWRQNRRSK